MNITILFQYITTFVRINIINFCISFLFSLFYFPYFVYEIKAILFSIAYHFISLIAILFIWSFFNSLLLSKMHILRLKQGFFIVQKTILLFILTSLYIGSTIAQEHIGETVSIPLFLEVLANYKVFIQLALLTDPVIFILGILISLLISGYIFCSAKRQVSNYQKLWEYNNSKFGSFFLGTNLLILFLTLFVIPIKLDGKFDRTPIWFFDLPNQYDPIIGSIADSYFGIQTQKGVKLRKSGFEDLDYTYPINHQSNGKNVVLIVVDALRADNLPFYGYTRNTSPFLSELYQKGRLKKIEYATSTCTSSFCGILSTLSGVEAINLKLVNYNLFDILKTQGYTNYFITSGIFDSFYNLKTKLGTNIDFYKEAKDTKILAANNDEIILHQLEQVPSSTANQPSFFYFHLMSTHTLGKRLVKSYEPTKLGRHLPLVKRIEGYTNYYDNGIRTSDEVIRQIYSALEKKGILKDCLIIITSDHGEELGERGKFAHQQCPYRDQIKIPLLIHDTDSIANYKNTFYASQMDIAPTIIDRLGLPKPEIWQGASFYSNSFNAQITIQDSPPCIGLLKINQDSSMNKIIYRKKKKNFELFDLNKDPMESNSLEINKEWQVLFENKIQL